MPDIASSILGLRGWAAVAVVFALPALESSAFVGFIFPGEIAVILGGVLAYNHRVNLALVMAAAVIGAIVGDTIGYSVGRRWGNRLLEGPLSRFIPPDKAERGKQYLLKRGGRAVFFGRFTAALRVMVPGLAGMSGVPYTRFAVSNVLGGTIWAVSFTLLGYAAGASWREVERTARNAGLLLLGVIIVVAAVVGVARWAAHHPDQVRARLGWIARLPGVRWVRARFEGQLAWLGARVRPSEVLGLSLTLAFAATLLLGTGFALLGSSVAGPGIQRRLDQPVLDWLVQHRSPEFTWAMKVVTAFGSTLVMVPLIAIAGLVCWRRSGRLRPLLLLAVAASGGWGLSSVMKELVGRPRPPLSVHLVSISAWAYPSGHATQAMALYGCAAALTAASVTRWSAKVTAWAAASLVIAAIGFSRLYLGVHWLTDVLGGYALGAVWLGLVLIVTRLTDFVGSGSRSRSGSGSGSGSGSRSGSGEASAGEDGQLDEPLVGLAGPVHG
jgi:membrane protein DedA with SNARE-associated domain/membrane-associated phospholipid phosphatase